MSELKVKGQLTEKERNNATCIFGAWRRQSGHSIAMTAETFDTLLGLVQFAYDQGCEDGIAPYINRKGEVSE